MEAPWQRTKSSCLSHSSASCSPSPSQPFFPTASPRLLQRHPWKARTTTRQSRRPSGHDLHARTGPRLESASGTVGWNGWPGGACRCDTAARADYREDDGYRREAAGLSKRRFSRPPPGRHPASSLRDEVPRAPGTIPCLPRFSGCRSVAKRATRSEFSMRSTLLPPAPDRHHQPGGSDRCDCDAEACN